MHLVASDTFYYSNSKKIYLLPIDIQTTTSKASSRIPQGINYYKTENNSVVGVSNKVIVKFNNLDDFETIVKDFNLTTLKEVYTNVYLFELKDNSNTLDIANELYNLESIKYAHPNFIREAKHR